jgi:hypothetical protein
MIFGGQSLQELTIKDFEILIQNRVPEGPSLEYKESAYSGRSDDIREMLRDIIAIANAEGGYLIMGIRKDTSCRAEAILPITNAHAKVQPIRQACLDGISERIEGLEIKAFECSNEEGIIVVYIPKSDRRPHMVSREHRTDFYRRYDTDKRTMTIDEIRSLVINNPTTTHLIELELLANGKVIKPNQATKKSGPPFVRIYTERSVDQFLQKYMVCNAFPQTLVIVSPFISDLSGELIDLMDIVKKINQSRTLTYVITRPPKERYQMDSIAILSQSPYVEIRYNEDIHAKLYICWCRKNEDESFALFGSGNLTAGGIRQNLELGMMIYFEDHGRTLIRDLYQWSTVGLRSQSKRIKQATRPL